MKEPIGCYVIGRRLDVSAAMYRTDRCDGHVSWWSPGRFGAYHTLLDTDANLAIVYTFLQALRVRHSSCTFLYRTQTDILSLLGCFRSSNSSYLLLVRYRVSSKSQTSCLTPKDRAQQADHAYYHQNLLLVASPQRPFGNFRKRKLGRHVDQDQEWGHGS